MSLIGVESGYGPTAQVERECDEQGEGSVGERQRRLFDGTLAGNIYFSVSNCIWCVGTHSGEGAKADLRLLFASLLQVHRFHPP